MMNNFREGVLEATTNCFFDALSQVIEQIEKEDMVSEEWAALKFLSNALDNVSSFKLGADAGMFGGDILFNSSDTILRYYEMKTMASAREALITGIKRQDKKIEDSDDWENISLVCDLLSDLLYVNMRGEYCFYSLLMEDEGLLNVWFPAGEDTESWFNAMLDINFYIQNNIDNIFPNWDYYIKDEEADIWDAAVGVWGDMPADVFLKRAFRQAAGSETEICFICDDFDGDETAEAFGITGTDDGYSLNNVKIYYIGSDGLAFCIDTIEDLYGYGNLYLSMHTDYVIMDTESAKFLVLGGGDGQETWLYGIRDKKPYQPKVSGQHASFTKTEDGMYVAEPHEGGEGYYRILYDYDPAAGEFVVHETAGT